MQLVQTLPPKRHDLMVVQMAEVSNRGPPMGVEQAQSVAS
jgi:hypothetical protein